MAPSGVVLGALSVEVPNIVLGGFAHTKSVKGVLLEALSIAFLADIVKTRLCVSECLCARVCGAWDRRLFLPTTTDKVRTFLPVAMFAMMFGPWGADRCVLELSTLTRYDGVTPNFIMGTERRIAGRR